MNSQSSQSPFSKPASLRGSRSPVVGRRVFTRPPFPSNDTEVPQVADHGGPFTSTPADVLLELSLGLERGGVARLLQQPKVQRIPMPHPLHRRDRSAYAWFESMGFLLAIGSVAGACAAILM